MSNATSTKHRGVQQLTVGGNTAAANIAVADIRVGDQLLSVSGHDQTDVTTAPTLDNLLDEASITSDGNIQCSTTDTTNFVLQVTWLPRNVGERDPGEGNVILDKQLLDPSDAGYLRPA